MPAIFTLLENLPKNVVSSHRDYPGTGPASEIYSVSLNRVVDSFNLLLDVYEPFIHRYDERLLPQLSANTERLLNALNSHCEDCYEILKSIFPKTKHYKPDIAVSRYLHNSCHPTFRRFREKILVYRDTFADIVNKCKHEHGIINCIWMENNNGDAITGYFPALGRETVNFSSYILGYYLETFDNEGFRGPDTKFHPNQDAISFSHNLRWHFYSLYSVSEYLIEAVIEAVKQTHNIDISSIHMEASKDLNPLIKLARRISSLPLLIFPNEFSIEFPDVNFTRDIEDEITLEFQTYDNCFFVWDEKSRFRMTGRLATTKLKLPFGKGMPADYEGVSVSVYKEEIY